MSTTDWNQQQMYRDPMMGSSQKGRWIPEQGVTDHLGNPIPQNWDFFAPPPPAIGKVVSAGSSLDLGEEPMAPATRTIIALTAAGIAGGIGVAIGVVMELPILAIGVGLTLAATGFWVAYANTTFDHICHYVGTEGMASITCSGSRIDLLPPEMFRFDQAAEVRNAICHNYYKGAYTGTGYNYTWTDAGGNTVHYISGTHHYEINFPPANDLFCFGCSGELEWTNWIKDRAEQQMKQVGFYQFNVEGTGYVRIGPRWVEFNLDGTPQRLQTENISFANLEAGVLTIKRHGATEGWFSSEGVFTFDYGSLGNAQLFLMLFRKYVYNIV